MFGFHSKKDKAALRRKKARKRKLFLFFLFSPVLYLIGSGPAIWSRTQVSNKLWRKGVLYYVAPVMWVNYQFRERSLIEKVGVVDLTHSDNLPWYNYLESYWGLFGKKTQSEATKITMLLKIKFHGSWKDTL